MTLPVTLLFHDDESAISLVSRLAHANGYDSLQSFLAFTYTNKEAITHGDLDALSEISNLSGVSIKRLVKSCIVRQPLGLNWGLGYATFSKEMRPGKTLRYCTQCVLNDFDHGVGRPFSRPYARSWWYCRGIEGCPEHGRRLVETTVGSLEDRDDLTTFISANLKLIREQALKEDTSSAPQLDRYLRDRIFQRGGKDFINSLNEHIVFELSGYLGHFISAQSLSDWQSEVTDQREWGFALASKGRAEIERVFAEVIDQTRPTARLLEQFFGPLIRWLRRNEAKPAYDVVVTMFQQIAEKNIPLGPEMKFIRPVEKRHLFCVNSAHAEYGLTKKRIKALISAHGLTTRPHLSDSSIYFDAESARQIFEIANGTLTSKEAANILGMSENVLLATVKAEILQRSEAREKGRDYLRINNSDLHEFQTKIIEKAEIFTEDSPEWRAPSEIAKAGVSVPDIIELIICGNVQARIKPGSEGLFKRLRVHGNEVRQHLHKTEESKNNPFLPFKKGNALLGASAATLNELIKCGFVKEKPGSRGKTAIRFIEKSSIFDFKKQYISLADLREHLGISRVGMKDYLAKMDILPLFGMSSRCTSYYSKADLRKANLL